MDGSVDRPSANFTKAYKMDKVICWLNRGGDVNCTSFSTQGHSILMTACVQDHAELTAELLRRGANPDTKTNGKTALHHAVKMGHPKCVKLLLEAGADPLIRVDVDNSEFTENDGMSALEIIQSDIELEGLRPQNRDCLKLVSQYTEEALARHRAARGARSRSPPPARAA